MTGILGTRIMAALAALFSVLALNLALLVFSLPVVTLPAAVSAATQALERWRRDGEDQVVREFLIGFRAQWARQTVLVGVPLAAAVLGVIEVRHFAASGGAGDRLALGFGTVALLVTVSALGYVFLLSARELEGPNGLNGLERADCLKEVDGLKVVRGLKVVHGLEGMDGLEGTAAPGDRASLPGSPGAGPAVTTAAEFWTGCVRLGIRNLFVTGPLFLVVIGGAAVLAWIDPPLLLLGLPLLALQLMRVTARFGLRRAGGARA
jgi:Protein of unknown function, DUF624